MHSSLTEPFMLLLVVISMTRLCAAAQRLEPARVSCNASYSDPCARLNSRYLAMNVSTYEPDDDLFQKINAGEMNMQVGFYPFVFDRSTKLCVAHGADRDLVGLDLSQIFTKYKLEFADGKALYARFEAAADKGGNWVQYLWSDGGSANSKLAFVTNFTTSSYMVGVGYEDAQLPPDLPCSSEHDSFCSATNARSLVGKAQFHLFKAGSSLANFESAVYDISFSDDFKIEGGFYVFMYNYDGRLKAHGVLRGSFGLPLSKILQKQFGNSQDGEALNEKFVSAAEGTGWVQYQWRDSVDKPVYTKVALIVKVEFGEDDFYLGVGYQFARENPVPGPLGVPCSDKSNLPCAFATSLQLSSHALSHAVSSERPADDVFATVSIGPEFRIGDFYAFFYDFEGQCVAHGFKPEYRGKTLDEIVHLNNIPLDGNKLHSQFVDAALQGGGWVQYDWLIPGVKNSDFQKIAYIFRLNLNGNDYYGGVGFNHEQAPVRINADLGQKKNGSPVQCSSVYGLNCSEVNSQAILGEALARLTLASSDARIATEVVNPMSVDDILDSITQGTNPRLSVNDFHVMVFTTNVSECSGDDVLSGCCVAHGGDSKLIHHTWEEILESDGITSIQGNELHRQLFQRAKSGVGWIETPWSRDTGIAQTKRWWTSYFRSDGQEYYVVADYLKTEPPPTCESCPDDQECTFDDQSYCEPKPPLPLTENPLVLALIILFSVGTPLVGLFFWYQKTRTKIKSMQELNKMNQKVQEMAERLEKQMQGMFEVVANMPYSHQAAYQKHVGNNSQAGSSLSVGVWYWEEDATYLESHPSSMVLSDSAFVRYPSDVSEQLEKAYQFYLEGRGFRHFHLDLSNTLKGGKIHNAQTGLQFEIDFESFTQKNMKSNHKRKIQREEVRFQADPTVKNKLPPLPDDIDFDEDGEDILPTSKGQIIQVSKVHPNSLWLYGNILYDPLLHDALDQPKDHGAELNKVLAHALHDRPTSGWFPRCVVQDADVNVMQKLLSTLGKDGADTLSPPDTWSTDNSRAFKDGKVEVLKGSTEYIEVNNYFMAALYTEAAHISVVMIERIQNLPLWQSYAVKKQTMLTRDTCNPKGRENNLDITDVERRWLFHGTTTEIIPKVGRQGFNRAFAGRNAVIYGRGVYFARDASYSAHRMYSVPDNRGVQRMFLCRVAVGDWCKGEKDQLTPAPKKNSPLELFDTTVDSVSNPSIFVVYHDAQAYPEYLVSFKNTKNAA